MPQLIGSNWMSLYQLAIYHTVLLLWKVKQNRGPSRLIGRLDNLDNSQARLLLTKRVWSQKAEEVFGQITPICSGAVRISQLKRTLSEWVKANVPVYEE